QLPSSEQALAVAVADLGGVVRRPQGELRHGERIEEGADVVRQVRLHRHALDLRHLAQPLHRRAPVWQYQILRFRRDEELDAARQLGDAVEDAVQPGLVVAEGLRLDAGQLGVPGAVVAGVVAPLQPGAEQDEKGHVSYSYSVMSRLTRSEKNSCPTTSAWRTPRAVRRMHDPPSWISPSPASASHTGAKASRASVANSARKAARSRPSYSSDWMTKRRRRSSPSRAKPYDTRLSFSLMRRT